LILPLGMRVLVQLIRDEDRTDAGLYLPAGAKEAQDDAMYGKVIEVARDRPTTNEATENVSGVPHGAHVLFRKDAGVRVPWDDRLRVIDVKDILATVEEVHPDDAH
jgi:chaperonin GroES